MPRCGGCAGSTHGQGGPLHCRDTPCIPCLSKKRRVRPLMHFSQRKEKKRKRKKEEEPRRNKENQKKRKERRKKERGRRKKGPSRKLSTNIQTFFVQYMPQVMLQPIRIDEALSLKVVVKKSQSLKHIHAVEFSRFAEFGI